VSSLARPRLALTRAEAAEALGMSIDSFERYVQAEVRLIRRGRIRLVPIGELERWLVENAERPMAEQLTRMR
jgi:hypothetical protein